jgi:hypothetical protein
MRRYADGDETDIIRQCLVLVWRYTRADRRIDDHTASNPDLDRIGGGHVFRAFLMTAAMILLAMATAVFAWSTYP